MPNKRLYYLDMAKGVGIFLVILGHIEYLDPDIKRWIASFHMPLFFVAGGVLAYVKEASPVSLGEQWIRRAKGILVPYVSFSVIMLTMRTFEYFVQPERITGRELIKELIESLTGYGLYTLWFLPAYFLSGLLFSLLCRSQRGRRYGQLRLGFYIFLLSGFGLLMASVLHVTEYPVTEGTFGWYAVMDILIVFLRALIVQPFFWLGHLYGKISSGAEKKSMLCLSGLLFLGMGIFLSGQLPVMDLHYLILSPLHYGAAAFSCAGLLNLLRAAPVSRAVSYLGRNSLIIMCTHTGMFVLYYVSLGMFFVRKLIPMTDLVLYISIAAAACVAELPIIWIFNRYFKYLLGRT
ncbi:MAG: acyltransferase family protein [Lachnospiraceae bacterium]|nr:acyltransferase family protein [Lachnospiraceae bacterium]GFI08406.1 hypothetical protein IMSAGC007_00854 [Lachnospiraceae bacterium]